MAGGRDPATQLALVPAGPSTSPSMGRRRRWCRRLGSSPRGPRRPGPAGSRPLAGGRPPPPRSPPRSSTPTAPRWRSSGRAWSASAGPGVGRRWSVARRRRVGRTVGRSTSAGGMPPSAPSPAPGRHRRTAASPRHPRARPLEGGGHLRLTHDATGMGSSVVLIGIVPVALAAACGTSGYASNGADEPAASVGRPLVAELYRFCSARYAAAVDPTHDGTLTPEQALTAYLAVPNVFGLQGKLFEPARPPGPTSPSSPCPLIGTPTPATATTLPARQSSPQWYTRHDQRRAGCRRSSGWTTPPKVGRSPPSGAARPAPSRPRPRRPSPARRRAPSRRPGRELGSRSGRRRDPRTASLWSNGCCPPTRVSAIRADLTRVLDDVPYGRNDFEGFATKRIYNIFAKTRFSTTWQCTRCCSVCSTRCSASTSSPLPSASRSVPGRRRGHPPRRRHLSPAVAARRGRRQLDVGVRRLHGGQRRAPSSPPAATGVPWVRTPRTLRDDPADDACRIGGLLPRDRAARWRSEPHDRPRLGVILKYCATWIRPQENHVIELPRGSRATCRRHCRNCSATTSTHPSSATSTAATRASTSTSPAPTASPSRETCQPSDSSQVGVR